MLCPQKHAQHRPVISDVAENSTAIENLQLQHMNRQQHIKVLEKRLEEVYDHLQTKIKAVDAIQEKNANLQQEITSLIRTCGYINGPYRMEATQCQFQLQQNSESKPTISSKPSEKVIYSRFMESQSIANLFHGDARSSEKSLSTLNKILGPSCSYTPQNQENVCPSSFSHESNILSQGQDHIPDLFPKGREAPSLWDLMAGKAQEKPVPAKSFSSSACSAIGNLKIVELHPSGRFLKIINSSRCTEEDIGGYILQQNLNGHPRSTYKFSPRIRMKANSEIKVWTASSKMTHKPPIHFLWKNLDKFIVSPECTTILCNPSGQAVAWYTPINQKQKQTLDGKEDVGNFENFKQCSVHSHKPRDGWQLKSNDTVQTIASQSPAEKEKEPESIIRGEKTPPPLYPVQSPWCRSPNTSTHPHYSVERLLAMGNYGRSLFGQTRSQSVEPDPHPDVPCTGQSQGKKVVSRSCNGKRRRSTRSAGRCGQTLAKASNLKSS
ncbi:lamin tail domain-containing protein 1 isoform X2 [Sphaerodactylus townsendi]|uniref:lamin tail domain-containing protein 1 isoform X2 n=1 Tax=Sphaerodactylus townsendi TaxID=933632 RepID=UPI0020269F26|nr:lamin tail domain-containing protein 1 isoform X2 [Sphaerodactylus townsendi]